MALSTYPIAQTKNQMAIKSGHSVHSIRSVGRSSRKWAFITILVGLWSVALALHFHQGGVVADAAAQSSRYTVKSGDTVWSIAVSLSGEEDPRLVADEIERLNHLNGDEMIQPGQILSMPAK